MIISFRALFINLSSSNLTFKMLNHQNPTKKLSSGNLIPFVGLGTYQIKGNDCFNAVSWAIQAGYTHIDTASIYKNQQEVGRVLEELKVDRSKIFITSKIEPGDQGYEKAKQSCNNMLKRLRTNYLDLLIIHWPGVSGVDVASPKNSEIRRQTWKALVQLQKQGKVRDIGVSNYMKWHLEDLLKHSDVKPAINQFEIHPLLWEKDTINFCRQHGIVVEAYSSLARNDDRLFKNQVIINLSKKYSKTIAQICLRWGLQHDFVVLPKSTSKERIISNFQLFDFQISAQDMVLIDSLTKHNIRTCWNPNTISV